uniref:Uncharacterized protein n=1 Tax=Romanomermis culicivorax TaxID=13658 RepID=A0A915IGF5_ROMCU
MTQFVKFLENESAPPMTTTTTFKRSGSDKNSRASTPTAPIGGLTVELPTFHSNDNDSSANFLKSVLQHKETLLKLGPTERLNSSEADGGKDVKHVALVWKAVDFTKTVAQLEVGDIRSRL